nr:sensor domain-containing diguanylate cyclase [Lachnospiraceae bacterium]
MSKFITAKVVNESLRLALRERDATRAIELFLEHMGERSHSERIYIFEGKQGCSVNNTFEWCAQGVSPQKDNLQGVPFEAVKWWYHAFEESRSILIYNLEDIKESEPLTYEYLQPQNVHSLIASPLELEGEIIGFYGVDNPPPEAMEDATYFAEMVGHFIVSLLEKQRMIQQMEKLSYEDSLSGVQNRHALNDYIDYHKNLRSVGILYCDVLGLKKVNDTQGHQAGDDLIIRASESLKKNFRKKDIYRVGGDEFLVICKDISEQIFEAKVEQLRNDMVDYRAMMSLGAVWRETVTDVDAAIAQADGLMYEEKRAYYASVK